MKILTAILGLILTTVLLVAGCSAQGSQVGELAPDFQLPDLDGQSQRVRICQLLCAEAL